MIAASHITMVDLNDPIISGVEPENPADGQLWLDTSGETDALKRWDGAQWVDCTVSPGD